jgi:hypothetical protein
LRGGLGESGLGDDRACGIGGVRYEAESERSEGEEADGAIKEIHG